MQITLNQKQAKNFILLKIDTLHYNEDFKASFSNNVEGKIFLNQNPETHHFENVLQYFDFFLDLFVCLRKQFGETEMNSQNISVSSNLHFPAKNHLTEKCPH